MIYIVVIAFAMGVIVQIRFKRLLLATGSPIAAYVLWSTLYEFLIPHHGGGASLWPIDILFVTPVAGGAGFSGAFLVIIFHRLKNMIKV